MITKDNLAVPYTFRMNVTTAGTPETLGVKISAATIAFVHTDADSGDTITDSGNGFLIAGFQPNDTITITGSASNNSTFTIKTVTAGTITLTRGQVLANESAGSTVVIKAPKTVPGGVKMVVKAYNANTSTIHLADSSVKAVNSTTGNFRLRNNESVTLQITSTGSLWLDAAVSGEGVEVLFEKNAAD